MNCPECGCVITEATKHARSIPQHRRFFALMKAAFMHWPATAEFRPKNAEHLRYFLECEAGHFTVVKTIRIESAVEPSKLAAVLTAVLRSSEDDKMFVDVDGALVTVRRANSINHSDLSHLAACALFQEVDDVLHVYGLSAEELLREARNAA